jgi:hypothetical protein
MVYPSRNQNIIVNILLLSILYVFKNCNFYALSCPKESSNRKQYILSKLEEYKEHIEDGIRSIPLPQDYASMIRLESELAPKSFPYLSMVGTFM